MKVTRRELALALAPAAALAQTEAGDELTDARARLKANQDALAKLQVPMETEPAFQFKA